jgi:hypothetical protein
MRLPTRAVAASRLRFALGVVVLAVLLAGSSVTAAADPTGSPSSTASSAASPTPGTLTPTPTPTAAATATGTSSATTSDVTPSTPASAEADASGPKQLKAAKVPVVAGAGIASLQARLPGKLRQLVALAATTQQNARVAAAAAPALLPP